MRVCTCEDKSSLLSVEWQMSQDDTTSEMNPEKNCLGHGNIYIPARCDGQLSNNVVCICILVSGWMVLWKKFVKQESPPAWTQEAYRPPHIKYSICCLIPGGVPHLWRGVPYIRMASHGVYILPPSEAGRGTHPLDLARVPPKVWTDWKHYLPHPSDAGGNYGRTRNVTFTWCDYTIVHNWATCNLCLSSLNTRTQCLEERH